MFSVPTDRQQLSKPAAYQRAPPPGRR